MRDAQRRGLGETGGLGSTAAAARFDEGVCLLEQLLVEAIASLRRQTAVMLSHAPGRGRGARLTGPEGESSPRSLPGASKPVD
ncbi:hypothetical protein ACKI1Q_40975 [Streptomyces galilaeus]|uniref:hypothetical protein n=1 Tax=Streptomyces galilaeus TaxID=33899 RepID=UPI0038F68E4E